MKKPRVMCSGSTLDALREELARLESEGGW